MYIIGVSYKDITIGLNDIRLFIPPKDSRKFENKILHSMNTWTIKRELKRQQVQTGLKVIQL